MKYNGRLCFQFVHHPGGRCTPSPSHNTSTGPMSFLGGTPVTGPRSLLRGYPSDWFQVPSQGVSQSWLGVPHDGQVSMGIPQPGLGYTPPPRIGYTWTGYAGLSCYCSIFYNQTTVIFYMCSFIFYS